jgi:predicted O-methyltransferase YrrM
MPETELKTLEQLAQVIPPHGRMVEIGPFLGRSSWCWAKSVHPTVKVICLDIWNPAEHPYHPPTTIGQPGAINTEFGVAESLHEVVGSLENFRRNTSDCHNIETIQGASPHDFKDWQEPVDLVFLDGVHHNPIFWEDLNFWFWKLHPGGICCGDDCAKTHPDVLWGIHDFAKNHGLTFLVKGRIWVMARPPHKDVIPGLFGGS